MFFRDPLRKTLFLLLLGLRAPALRADYNEDPPVGAADAKADDVRPRRERRGEPPEGTTDVSPKKADVLRSAGHDAAADRLENKGDRHEKREERKPKQHGRFPGRGARRTIGN